MTCRSNLGRNTVFEHKLVGGIGVVAYREALVVYIAHPEVIGNVESEKQRHLPGSAIGKS